MSNFTRRLRCLPFCSRANREARRNRHQRLFQTVGAQGVISKIVSFLGLKKQTSNTAAAGFVEVHQALTVRQKFLQRKLAATTLVAGLILTLAHGCFLTQAQGASYELSLDETYAMLAANTDNEIPSVTEGGFFLSAAQNGASSDRLGVTGTFTYEVQAGDSLSMIASKFGIDTNTILNANNISNANSLRVGQKLVILPVKGLLHEVKSGDTPATLATRYQTDVSKILAQNNLTEEDSLVAGTKLLIPDGTPYQAVTTQRYLVSTRDSSTTREAGAMPSVTPAINGKLLWPTSGRITQYFTSSHYAIDIANREKPMIVASKSGTIITSSDGWNGGYGNYVIIDHGDGMQTLYAHMDYRTVSVGDTVNAGDVIGRMGNTGRVYGVTGIHVHFEVRVNGVKQNPLAYL